jgi:ABC-type transport system substrate-binding protein
VAEARSTFNVTQRQALLNQAQAIAYEEAPWIWL